MPVPSIVAKQANVEARSAQGAGPARSATPEEQVTRVEAVPEAEHARRLASGPAEPAGPSGQDIRLLASLQRRFGNDHVNRVLGAVHRASGITVQRQGGNVALTGIKLSAATVTIPLQSGISLTASAVPAKATGVTFSVEKATVDPTGVTIDATTGVITIAAGQQGGTVKVKAKDSGGAEAWQELRLIEKPVAIVSTAASSGGGTSYGGQFTHTFSAPSGKASGLEGGRINEKFDSLTAASPFGADFALSANAAGSAGWGLDSAGTMTGPDNVTIGKKGVDIGRFTKSASSPTPKSLPASFTMTQHLHAKSQPGGLDATPFTDADHIRTLTDKQTFTVEAGKGKTTDPYDGPPAYTNATAAPASVVASPPKPKAPKGGTPPAWNRNKVQVTADTVPSGGAKVFAIKGKALGCTIDPATGEVLIGDTAGTITVRVQEKAGKAKNFDEVTITITPRPAPVPVPKPTSKP